MLFQQVISLPIATANLVIGEQWIDDDIRTRLLGAWREDPKKYLKKNKEAMKKKNIKPKNYGNSIYAKLLEQMPPEFFLS